MQAERQSRFFAKRECGDFTPAREAFTLKKLSFEFLTLNGRSLASYSLRKS